MTRDPAQERMSRWMSLVAGRRIEMPAITEVEHLVETRHVSRFLHLNVDLPELAAFHERVVLATLADREVTAEIYVPQGTPPFPVLLFLHGGGFYRGSAEDERKLGMQLAERGIVVVNLDYALAPEQPFPKGLEDCVLAARWIVQSIGAYGGDGTRLAVAGASSGGNLAAATIAHLNGGEGELEAHGLGAVEARVSAGLFVYGFFDLVPAVEAKRADPTRNVVPMQGYLGPDWTEHASNPLVSPQRSDLTAFPPCYLSCGAEDGVLPATLAMTRALADAKVPTTLSVVEGADHIFLNIPHVVPGATPELARIVDWLLAHLGGESRPATAAATAGPADG